MKTTFYTLYNLEDFKKLIFYKLSKLGFNNVSSTSVLVDDLHNVIAKETIQAEIDKIESTLNLYKEYLLKLSSENS